jgi:hypothetical protein
MEKQQVEKPVFAVGDRVEKLCAACGVERGHVVASITKRGQISRVTCPICATRSSFKSSDSSNRSVLKAGAPYDPKRTYRAGQTIVHPAFGPGEVTAIIEPQKIDVLFSDRLRRLIHARI